MSSSRTESVSYYLLDNHQETREMVSSVLHHFNNFFKVKPEEVFNEEAYDVNQNWFHGIKNPSYLCNSVWFTNSQNEELAGIDAKNFAERFYRDFVNHFGVSEYQSHCDNVRNIYLISTKDCHKNRNKSFAQKIADALYEKEFHNVFVHIILPPPDKMYLEDTYQQADYDHMNLAYEDQQWKAYLYNKQNKAIKNYLFMSTNNIKEELDHCDNIVKPAKSQLEYVHPNIRLIQEALKNEIEFLSKTPEYKQLTAFLEFWSTEIDANKKKAVWIIQSMINMFNSKSKTNIILEQICALLHKLKELAKPVDYHYYYQPPQKENIVNQSIENISANQSSNKSTSTFPQSGVDDSRAYVAEINNNVNMVKNDQLNRSFNWIKRSARFLGASTFGNYGMMVGAAIGSTVPIVGTLIGGIVGGIIGAIVGYRVGKILGRAGHVTVSKSSNIDISDHLDGRMLTLSYPEKYTVSKEVFDNVNARFKSHKQSVTTVYYFMNQLKEAKYHDLKSQIPFTDSWSRKARLNEYIKAVQDGRLCVTATNIYNFDGTLFMKNSDRIMLKTAEFKDLPRLPSYQR